MNQDQTRTQKKKPLGGAAVFYYGEPMVWLTGSALAMCVIMIAGFLLYILWMGMSTFWPSDLHEFELKDKHVSLVKFTQRNRIVSPRILLITCLRICIKQLLV